MKQLKIHMTAGAVFVLLLGSASHFFYEWSNHNFIVGLLSPVNESVWEHMKLLFFPMFLYSLVTIPKLKIHYPCISSAFPAGIVLGTLLIPVVFFTYTGILGRHFLILDIGTFFISVLLAFYAVFSRTLSCRPTKHVFLLYAILFLLTAAFFVFSYCPPEIPLFADPSVPKL